MRALGERELQLAGRVSEIEMIDDETTGLTLMNGTRVLGTAWPPSRRRLSALRVVLADLEHKQIEAEEVDLRYKDQVIVRPAAEPAATGQG